MYFNYPPLLLGMAISVSLFFLFLLYALVRKDEDEDCRENCEKTCKSDSQREKRADRE